MMVPQGGYFDADKNYYMRIFNPTLGEFRSIPFGKNIDPEMIRKVEIQSDAPKGRFGALTKAQQIISESAADPNSHPQWEVTAAQGLVNEFEQTGQLTNARITALNQGITGYPVKPVTPQQQFGQAVEIAKQKREAQKDIDNAQSIRNSALDARESKGKEKEAAWQAVQGAVNKINQIKKDYGEDYVSYSAAPEYKSGMSEYHTAMTRANQLQGEYDTLQQKYVRADSDLSAAYKR